MAVRKAVEDPAEIYKNVPESIKDLSQWVGYMFVDNPDQGKPDKIPINPVKLWGAKSNDPGTWSNLQTALHSFGKTATCFVYRKKERVKASGAVAGLGFMFANGVCGIDIDHCIEDGEISDMARGVISLMDTYTEYSPSGTGFHLIFKCDMSKIPTYEEKYTDKETREVRKKLKLDKKYYQKNVQNGFECYFGGLTNRFFTYTGKRINDKAVEDRTEQVLVFLDRYMKNEAPPVDRANSRNSSNSYKPGDAPDIIAVIRRAQNAAKFEKLYDRGDPSDYARNNNDGSINDGRSEADLALCNILAFYCQGDYNEIDRLFRQSALYRDKWERNDYSADTINRAIGLCGGRYYAPHKRATAAEDFTGADYALDIINAAKKVFDTKDKRELLLQVPYLYENRYSALCVNPALLADYLKNNLTYKLAKNDAFESVLIFVYTNGYYRSLDDPEFHAVIKNYIPTEIQKIGQIKETAELMLRDNNYMRLDEFNNNDDIINFQNGILKLSTMELLPHDEKYLCTIQIPCNWNEHPTHKGVFDKYMDDLTEGDAGKRKLLLQFMGVAVSNVEGYRMKKGLFTVGVGDSGKTQLRAFLAMLVGAKYNSSASLQDLEKPFGKTDCYNKRIIGSPDMEFSDVPELVVFKSLTGGDDIRIEFKYKNPFTYKFKGVLYFCANRLPRFAGDTGKWVYERMLIVRCDNAIPPEKQDKKLLEKMYAEREYAVWLFVNELKNVIANGYKYDIPLRVLEARKEFALDNKPANLILLEQYFDFLVTVESPDKKNPHVGQFYTAKEIATHYNEKRSYDEPALNAVVIGRLLNKVEYVTTNVKDGKRPAGNVVKFLAHKVEQHLINDDFC